MQTAKNRNEGDELMYKWFLPNASEEKGNERYKNHTSNQTFRGNKRINYEFTTDGNNGKKRTRNRAQTEPSDSLMSEETRGAN